ncbi:MAG: uracil-DNA glycosylase [Verrucomicrobia bacterium]|jgi:uracil-DNA glycosylase|nr:uracil-DNA glycosylase [Verrucomicrobiota bacterium]
MVLAFDHLLDATIEHLETLKSGGQASVHVADASMVSLREMIKDGKRHEPRPAHQNKPSQRFETPESKPRSAPPLTPDISPEEKDLIGRVEDWPDLAPELKESAFAKLRDQAESCERCSHLVQSRTQVVFGIGTVHADLMFVGEAPGMDEDREGEPFVGKAGQLLTKIIETMGLSRDRIYIGNVLKCRPDTPGRSFGNRKPTPMEMQTCWPFLMEQIKLIRPKVLVALGTTAVDGLLGKKTVGITRLRGRFQDFRGIPVMPTYHPAYVLRNPAKAIKRQVWEDMLQVMEHMGMPVSAKQRQFFTQ